MATALRIDVPDTRSRACGRLTQEGIKADASQFARNDLLPALDRARAIISRAKAEVVARRTKPKHQHVDEISELEEAIAAAESAVEAAYEEVRPLIAQAID